MLEIIILVLIEVFSFLIGYTINNKERLQLLERCLELSKSIKEYDNKIKMRDKLINRQLDKLIIKDKYFKKIIKIIENNNCDDTDMCKRKIKELAETAIQN